MNPALALLRHPQYQQGLRDMASLSLGISAWGLVTGVAMVKSGLSVPIALFMTFFVYAGSAQLAALPLMLVGAPIWVIWATALCVNLRFVIFSAQWRPYFMHLSRPRRLALGYLCADLSYIVFMARYKEPQPAARQVEYFLGGATLNWAAWQLPSVAGILLANVIPTEWGLGFAGVLALLGLLCSLLTDRASWTAAAVAVGAALAAFSLPFKLHIVVAIAAAVCAGLIAEGGDDAGKRLRAAFARRPRRAAPADRVQREGVAS